MEHFIGLLLIGGSLVVLVTLHNDAREQGWGWLARVVLYTSGIAVLALAVLITLGSTQAAKIMFVGFGAVMAVIVLLFLALALATGIVALRNRDHEDDDSDRAP